MSFRSVSLIAALCGALFAAAGGAHATTTLNLGQSAQDFTDVGLGPTSTPGIGSYALLQGAETDTATTRIFTLSGLIAGSSYPGFASGDYSFVTTIGVGESILGVNSAPFSNGFVYSFLPADTQMTLYLTNTPTGSHTIPIVTNGNFDGPGFGFAFTSATCSGLGALPCSEFNVGQTPGSSISGPVTIGISLAAVPEPATWALAILGVGMIGFAARRRREGLTVAA